MEKIWNSNSGCAIKVTKSGCPIKIQEGKYKMNLQQGSGNKQVYKRIDEELIQYFGLTPVDYLDLVPKRFHDRT